MLRKLARLVARWRNRPMRSGLAAKCQIVLVREHVAREVKPCCRSCVCDGERVQVSLQGHCSTTLWCGAEEQGYNQNTRSEKRSLAATREELHREQIVWTFEFHEMMRE